MEKQTIDAAEFRDEQRDQWSNAAPGWAKWSEVIDEAAGPVSERLVEMAGIKAGDRVLDVAAGYGEPSLTAAKAVGPDGHVVATDISEEMLRFGRQRAAKAGAENIEFVHSDAASLDYPADSFDAAVSRWGIIFEPDAEVAAEHIRGFLRPGGRFAIASWGPPERVPFIAIPMRTAMEKLGIEPPPPGTPGPLSRPTEDAIGGLLRAAGFSDVEVEEATVTMKFDSPAGCTEYTRDIAAPITAMVAPHPEDVQRETWQAITDAVRAEAGADGPFSFSSLALLAVGRA